MKRAACCLLLGIVGCATPSFLPQFRQPAAPSQRVVLGEITHGKARDERPVAVGITTQPQRLFAWDLSAGLLWERPVEAKSAPIVVADAVVTQEAGGIVVRDLASGEVRVVVDEGGHLIGADGEGRSIVIAIGYDSGDPRAALAFVEGHTMRWKQRLSLPVGVPALVGGYVIVPWATQRLSVLSSRDGRELARWDFQHSVLGYALVDRGHVYVGQHGLTQLDQTMLEHSSEIATPYAPFKRTLPGQPPLLRDGYLPVPEPSNAYHELRLDWRVSAGDGAIKAENDLLMLRFYRLLFALDAREDSIRWVRTFDHDLVGAAIQPGGMFVADAAGALSFLDASGITRMQRDLGRSLQVLTIRPGLWVPAAPAEAALAQPVALRDQLFAAASLHDDRLGAARAYAIEHLARISDPSVTAHLIALCADRKSPAELQSSACASLAKRANGGDDVISALSVRASFLEGRPQPPIGALAQAAGQMQLKQAGPLLTAQMEDPSTSARDLVFVLTAIEQLGHRPAGAAIERFVRLHHAEPEGSEVGPALYAALHALGTLRVRSARPTLLDVQDDQLTPSAVRVKAREAVALLDAPLVVRSESKSDAPSAEPEAADDEADDPVADPRPYALSAEMVRAALRPNGKALSQCLTTDPSRPRSARVSMVVQGEGHVEGVFVVPTTLQACIEPLVHDAQFPATRSGRQRVTHKVFGPNAVAAPIKPKAGKRPTAKLGAKPAAKPAASSAPAKTPIAVTGG
jgi:hypothetical protein